MDSSASAGASAAGAHRILFAGISFDALFTGNAWWNWLVLLALVVAGVAVGKILSVLLRRIGERMGKRGFHLRSELFASAAGPANLALITLGLDIGLMQLQMGPQLRTFVDSTITLLIYVTIFWYAFNIVSIVEILLRRFAERAETKLHVMLVPLIRKSLRVFIVVVGVLIVADNVFRQNIGTWLAGLGIVGLAVSLAAQDSLKNLFGSITILLDRPFRLGDRIVFAGFDGPVEEIGFRSIKIRTLAGHLVTVPNSKVVNETVENIGVRPYIQRVMKVGVTYDTSAEKLDEALRILKSILESPQLRDPIHGRIGADEFPPRVYFSGYTDWALEILVIYWFFPPAYWDYMEHAQRLNLQLLEEFGRAGISFAFPSQTLYLAGDAGAASDGAPRGHGAPAGGGPARRGAGNARSRGGS